MIFLLEDELRSTFFNHLQVDDDREWDEGESTASMVFRCNLCLEVILIFLEMLPDYGVSCLRNITS